jgi:hypothetical protein
VVPARDHLVVDGFSGWVIASRTAGIYTALVAGASPEAKSLEPLAVLADADARYRASASFGRDRDFWLGTLSGFGGAVSLSGRPSRSAAQAAVRSAHDLEADEVTGLRVAAQRLGTGISGLAVAAALYVRCTCAVRTPMHWAGRRGAGPLGAGPGHTGTADSGDDGERGPGPAAGEPGDGRR